MTPDLCHPRRLAWDTAAVPGSIAEALNSAPLVPAGVRYALLDAPTRMTQKPRAYDSAQALARAIHRRREGRAIQLKPAELVRGLCKVAAIGVYTLDEAGALDRCLGFAYLAGGDWRALQAELYAADPNPAPRAELH